MTGRREAQLLYRQKGQCPICRTVFDLHEVLKEDHVLPRSQGGNDRYDNLQLLHRVCHYSKPKYDRQGGCPVRPWSGDLGRRRAV